MARHDMPTIDPYAYGGLNLATDLNSYIPAWESMHLGSGAPAYAIAGTMYLDDASDPVWSFMAYDGADEIELFQIDTDSNEPIFDPAFLDATGAAENEILGIVGGVPTWTSLVAVLAQDGDANNPPFGFLSEASPNGMGMYRYSDNVLGWSTSGAFRMALDASGRLGLGTNAPAGLLHAIADAANAQIFLSSANAVGTTTGPQVVHRRSRGSHASPAALISGDFFARFTGAPYHSTGTPGFVNAAELIFLSDGVESGDTVPGAMSFRTMPSGGSITERFRISSAGQIRNLSGDVTGGVDDTTAALVAWFGDNGTQGARERWYNAASEDTNVEYFQIEPNGDGVNFGPNTDTDMFLFGGGGSIAGAFFALRTVVTGVTGVERGTLQAYRGTSTDKPGSLILEARSGTEYYFWVTDGGQLRVHTALPTADTDGSAV